MNRNLPFRKTSVAKEWLYVNKKYKVQKLQDKQDEDNDIKDGTHLWESVHMWGNWSVWADVKSIRG
jgi:hypothetical protein